MKKILYVDHWTGNGPAWLTKGDTPLAEVVPLYDLEHCDLEKFHSILMPSHVDQRYLMTQQTRLEAFVEAGGTLVLNGHVAYPFLKWLNVFEPVIARGLESLRIYPHTPHPIWEGVVCDEMMFRRGVAGFYARGSHPVPVGGVVINTMGPDRQPIDWTLTVPGGGRLLMHSGNDLWMFQHSDDSTGRIVPQLFAWLNRESV
jgi:hypothetical protein